MRTTKWRMALAIGVLAAFLTGCQSSSNQPQQAEAPGSDQTQAGGAKSASKGKLARRGSSGSEKAEQAAPPQPVTLTVPAGTVLPIRLVDALDSGTTTTGSTFEGTLAAPLAVNGTEVAPVGSSVTGKVTNAVSAGRLQKPAELSLTLTSLTPKGGQEVAITTSTWSESGASHKKRNTEFIGGGAAAGALVGALVGGKKGAAIGAGLGAGGGTGAAAYTGKKEIQLPAETKLEFKLAEAITLTAAK
jgi:hypothetical protein